MCEKPHDTVLSLADLKKSAPTSSFSDTMSSSSSYLALESISAMALSLPEMCRICGYRDLMYGTCPPQHGQVGSRASGDHAENRQAVRLYDHFCPDKVVFVDLYRRNDTPQLALDLGISSLSLA